MSAPTTLMILPPELLMSIADHLSTRDKSLFSRTCYALHTLLAPLLRKCFSEEATFILLWALVLPWHPDIARRALDSGADPNATNAGDNPYHPMWYDDEIPPLSLAVILDNVEAARLLLDGGADVNTVDGSMLTPMHHAQIFRQEKFLELLGKYGARDSRAVDTSDLVTHS